jgi:hypothetical protein
METRIENVRKLRKGSFMNLLVIVDFNHYRNPEEQLHDDSPLRKRQEARISLWNFSLQLMLGEWRSWRERQAAAVSVVTPECRQC